MSGTRPLRAVLWDVGNVIVRWDPRTLYSKIFSDPAERDAFLAEVCTMQWHTLHDAGRTFDDGVAELTSKFPRHAAPIAAWRDRWWEMFSGVIPETSEAIVAMDARGIAQYGLTNMSYETAPGTFAMAPAMERFGGIVISGLEGVIKPDPAIWRIAIRRFGLEPETTLFVDDSETNIAAARALGFAVHRFEDPAALRPALQAHGLL
jgi:FMN phosphatase YigB (HAD superfamily)